MNVGGGIGGRELRAGAGAGVRGGRARGVTHFNGTSNITFYF